MIVDLLPTEDQRMIEESIVGLLSARLPVERLREPQSHGGAAERAIWRDLSELGLFAMGVSEEQGGLGLGLPEEVLAAKAMGRFLASPALLAQMAAAHLTTDDALRADFLSGESRAALANEMHALDVEGTDWLVAAVSGKVALTARERGSEKPVESIDETLSLMRTSANGPFAADGAHVSLLIAAYLTGLAQAVLSLAVDYAQTREQFGQPIGAFQAIKHQCADMALRAAAAEAQLFHVAATFAHVPNGHAEVAAARLLAVEAALANARQCIQIHGGMGFTAECDAHLFLKRAQVLARLGSDRTSERHHLLASA